MASNGNAQRGGFGVGVVVGLLVGLVLALAVALYVTKAPIPFMDKVPQRTAEQDAAEVEKNKHWDPNAPLHGKNPAKPSQAPVPARVDSPAAAQDAVASAVAAALTSVLAIRISDSNWSVRSSSHRVLMATRWPRLARLRRR